MFANMVSWYSWPREQLWSRPLRPRRSRRRPVVTRSTWAAYSTACRQDRGPRTATRFRFLPRQARGPSGSDPTNRRPVRSAGSRTPDPQRFSDSPWLDHGPFVRAARTTVAPSAAAWPGRCGAEVGGCGGVLCRRRVPRRCAPALAAWPEVSAVRAGASVCVLGGDVQRTRSAAPTGRGSRRLGDRVAERATCGFPLRRASLLVPALTDEAGVVGLPVMPVDPPPRPTVCWCRSPW